MSGWIKDVVVHGNKGGKSIGFPTVNLDPGKVTFPLDEGVHSCKVRYGGNEFKGALYFGPRLVKGETKPVLEIFVLDFDMDIYGETVEYRIGRFIRGVMDFKNMDDLKNQISKDVSEIRLIEGP